MSANLVEFPRASKRDVATTLRAIADQIESGEYGPPEYVEMVCFVNNYGDKSRMLWGANAERDKVYRLLGLAQHLMDEEDAS